MEQKVNMDTNSDIATKREREEGENADMVEGKIVKKVKDYEFQVSYYTLTDYDRFLFSLGPPCRPLCKGHPPMSKYCSYKVAKLAKQYWPDKQTIYKVTAPYLSYISCFDDDQLKSDLQNEDIILSKKDGCVDAWKSFIKDIKSEFSSLFHD